MNKLREWSPLEFIAVGMALGLALAALERVAVFLWTTAG